MSFMRMLIGACLTAALVKTDDGDAALFFVLVALGFWALTNDPLPAAIERALESFRDRYQR